MILKMMFAGTVSITFCLLFQVRGWNILVAAINGALGYLLYLMYMNVGIHTALLVSSAFMALYAECAARIRKAPAILFLSAALVPIVPGGGMFNCALKVLEGARYQAIILFGNVMLEAGSIAIGIIIITSLLRFNSRKLK